MNMPAGNHRMAMRTVDLAVGYRARRTRRAVLERVNLTVSRGELVCLLGPNGIGKSTLLRTMTRMQPPLWGQVEIDGVDLASFTLAELAMRIGVVLTDRVLVDAFTVRSVVELGRYPHCGWLGRMTPRDRNAVNWALDAVGVSHLADGDFNRLSDGERQRTMIARALAQEPLVLVLDEPTAFLDVLSRIELMGLLRRLTRATDLAVVLSTHDLELALRMADTIWLVAPGGELVVGSPEDVTLSGALAGAFEGRHVRFHADDGGFRLLTGDRGTARVAGDPRRTSLARVVLEREGFDVVNGRTHGIDLAVEVTEHGWRIATSDLEHRGQDFRSLAAWLRGHTNPLGETES